MAGLRVAVGLVAFLDEVPTADGQEDPPPGRLMCSEGATRKVKDVTERGGVS